VGDNEYCAGFGCIKLSFSSFALFCLYIFFVTLLPKTSRLFVGGQVVAISMWQVSKERTYLFGKYALLAVLLHDLVLIRAKGQEW
jgi:hypothetical protein